MKLFSNIFLKSKANETTIFEKIAPRFEKKAPKKRLINNGSHRQFSVLNRLLPKKRARGKTKRLVREKRRSKRLRLLVKKLNVYAFAKKKVLSKLHGTSTKSRLKKVKPSKRKKRNSRATPWRGKALLLGKLAVRVRTSSKNKQQWTSLGFLRKKKKITKKLGLWKNLASRVRREKPAAWWRNFPASTKRKVILKKKQRKKKKTLLWIYGPNSKFRNAKVIRASIRKKQNKRRIVIYRPVYRHKKKLNPRFNRDVRFLRFLRRVRKVPFKRNIRFGRRLRLIRKLRRIRRRQRKYRFSRWKKFERQKWKFSSSNHLGVWATMALFPEKFRRRRYQPYRYRKAKQLKKNKWFRLLNKGRTPGLPVSRFWRLLNQQQYQKLYSSFYGILNRKKKKEKARHFLRIKGSGVEKRNVLFSWVERRLDVVLCRIRLAPTIKVARSLISRGFVWVNRKQILNINRRVEIWDVVEINRHYLPFLRYCYLRGRFRRYVFKKKGLRYKNVYQQKQATLFGFLMKVPFESDVPKKDLTTVSEVERLFLAD